VTSVKGDRDCGFDAGRDGGMPAVDFALSLVLIAAIVLIGWLVRARH
jgi:hypothetical protein